MSRSKRLFFLTLLNDPPFSSSNKDCNYASLDVDNSYGGQNGAETITVLSSETYVYTIFVELFIDAEWDGTLLAESGATVDFLFRCFDPCCPIVSMCFDSQSFLPLSSSPNIRVGVPSGDGSDLRYWVVGCYDSRVDEFRTLNYLVGTEPNTATVCIN